MKTSFRLPSHPTRAFVKAGTVSNFNSVHNELSKTQRFRRNSETFENSQELIRKVFKIVFDVSLQGKRRKTEKLKLKPGPCVVEERKVVWIKVSTSAQKLHLFFVHICSEMKKKSISGKTFSFQSALNWGEFRGWLSGRTDWLLRFEKDKNHSDEKNKLLPLSFKASRWALN